jgi:iron complex transport system ATP-binding protein
MAKGKGITVIMSLHEIDLAQKISDKIICVKGDTIESYGAPEEVFNESAIRALYDIDQGYYDPCFGSIELPRPKGEAQVLVISSSGRGIPIYRALQKENIPFCAGILYTNDLDYRLARLLATEVIEEKPFAEISDAALARAMAQVRSCKTVIDAGVDIGVCNKRIQELIDAARSLGKLQRGY